jgi:hypothetical protein
VVLVSAPLLWGDPAIKDRCQWEDQWPGRLMPDGGGYLIPRIWKDTSTPSERDGHPWKLHDGTQVTLVDEFGQWRWPWWYRLPGWVACYTDTFESALAIVNTWWQEEWIIRRFPKYDIGHSHAGYPWALPWPEGGYKPPGVYC